MFSLTNMKLILLAIIHILKSFAATAVYNKWLIFANKMFFVF